MLPYIKHPKPFAVHIELTEGCNRRCTFCGIHSLYRERLDEIYKFMSPELARLIARDLNRWLPKARLEFALQGEPLLNKNAPGIIRIFREEFNSNQSMLYSNMDPLREGKGFNADKILKLFKCGLNILTADYYGEVNDMPYEQFYNEIKNASSGIPVFDFYKDKETVWHYEGPNTMKIVCIDNTHDRNMNRTANNQAGNTNPNLFQIKPFKSKEQACHQPFRELSIKHDGSVPICCMDWQREHIINKFPEHSFQEIWESLHFRLIRELIINKRRDLLSPCDRCDYHGYRLGFLHKPFEGSLDTNHATLANYVKKEQDKNKNLANKYVDMPFDYTR